MNYTILDASNDFVDLSNSLGRFKEELCKELELDFRSQDFRLASLDTIQQYLLSLTSYIRAFVRLQQLVSPDEFLRIVNVGIKTIEEYEESTIIYKFPIQSLVTMIHFVIDSFLGEICRLKASPQTGFYKRMKMVLDEIEIDNGRKEEYQNTLQCLAFFRNSFHNNGFHSVYKGNWKGGIEPQKGEIDRKFAAEESTIVFKHNELITYTWRSVFLLIKESVESLRFLIKALNVQ
jgi:hypothetical protein